MRTKKSTSEPQFVAERIRDSDKVICKMSCPERPEWLVEGWVHLLSTREGDDGIMPSVFLRVSPGFPSRYLGRAYEAIRRAIGRVPTDRKKAEEFMVKLVRLQTQRTSNSLTEAEQTRKREELESALIPNGMNGISLPSFTDQTRKESSRAHQPASHRKRTRVPRTALKWIIAQARVQRTAHPEYPLRHAAELVKRDYDDERDTRTEASGEDRWPGLSLGSIESIVRGPKTYLKKIAFFHSLTVDKPL